MKTALVIGHAKDRKGACSPFGIPCEYDFNKEIAFMAAERNPEILILEHGGYKYGYKYMQTRTSNAINRLDIDLVFELHYNAAHPSANGAEALYYFANRKAAELAFKFALLMHDKMGYSPRQGKPLINKNDRGYWAVFLPKPTTLILEPFFGTNESDCKKMDKNKYVDVILETIEIYRNL